MIRAVSEVECEGFLDGINGWDNAFISLGPYHWVLGIAHNTRAGNVSGGTLPSFFAFLKEREQNGHHNAFTQAIGFFGAGVDKAWNRTGKELYLRSQRHFSRGRITLQQENGSFKAMPKTRREGGVQFGNYFRNWHWFYRFVMASRTIKGFQRDIWIFARLRIRGLLSLPMDIPHFTATRRTPPRLGEVYTSERAIALLLRWHVRAPAHIIRRGKPGSALTLAFSVAMSEMKRLRMPNLNDVSLWTDNHERILEQAIMDTAESYSKNPKYSFMKGFLGTMKVVRDFPVWRKRNRKNYTLASGIGGLSVKRDSFELDSGNLPPVP